MYYVYANLGTRVIFSIHMSILSSSKEKKVEEINDRQYTAMVSNDMAVTFIFSSVMESTLYNTLYSHTYVYIVCGLFLSRSP